jgi:hypothetical protein
VLAKVVIKEIFSMANHFFKQLLFEQIDLFVSSFCSSSQRLFYDQVKEKLVHPGEYGGYREAICRKFLKFLIPNRLDIGRGFLINAQEEISTECDIVIYDPKTTPLIQNEEFQRFFPIETVVAIGEVKSVLSKQQFKRAINKLSKVKKMRENITSPAIIWRKEPGAYAPHDCAFDQVFTFLICQKLDFDMNEITTEINKLYDKNTPYRYRHNLILSVEQGFILLYYDDSYKSVMYPVMNSIPLKNRLRASTEEEPYTSYTFFASYIFMATSITTILYPEITDYMGVSFGGLEMNEP